jgi:hypothetical protein
MKKWKIEINAIDEGQASKILKAMSEAFETASKFDLPMDSIFMDFKGNKEMSTLEFIKS